VAFVEHDPCLICVGLGLGEGLIERLLATDTVTVAGVADNAREGANEKRNLMA
jgi:hypothetical protein